MENFTYDSLPGRVIFGEGKIKEAGPELERLGVARALVLSTPEQAEDAQKLANALGDRAAGLFSGAAMHTPIEVTAMALREVEALGVDGIVSLGGGSTIGLGKAIALRTDLPQLAIPTTYAGSEMTPIIGQTENGVKTTQRTLAVLPETVIYDPELTYTLPAHIAGPSGMNAIAHVVEALYAENRNPITSMMAEDSIRALGEALPAIMSGAPAQEARAKAFYGSWIAGSCLATVGMALHHKICHTLGGSFDLNHAAIHCLMIPYTAAFNQEHADYAMQRVARALGAENAPSALFDLMLVTNQQHSLKAFGLAEQDLDKVADLAVQNPYYNPRPVTRQAIRAMLQDAWLGKRP